MEDNLEKNNEESNGFDNISFNDEINEKSLEDSNVEETNIQKNEEDLSDDSSINDTSNENVLNNSMNDEELDSNKELDETKENNMQEINLDNEENNDNIQKTFDPSQNNFAQMNNNFAPMNNTNKDSKGNKIKELFKKKGLLIGCAAICLVVIVAVIILLVSLLGNNKKGILYVEDGKLYAWYNEKTTKIRKFDEDEYRYLSSKYSNTDKYIVYKYDDTLYLYDFTKEKEIKVSSSISGMNVMFSSDDKYLFFIDEDDTIYKYIISKETKDKVFKTKGDYDDSSLEAVSKKKLYFSIEEYDDDRVVLYEYDIKKDEYDKLAIINEIEKLDEKLVYSTGDEDAYELHVLNLKNDKDETIATKVLDVYSFNDDFTEVYYTQASKTKVDMLDDDQKDNDPEETIVETKKCTWSMYYYYDQCTRDQYINGDMVEVKTVNSKKDVNDSIRNYFDGLQLYNLVRYKNGKSEVIVENVIDVEAANSELVIYDNLDTSKKIKISELETLSEAKIYVENNTSLYYKNSGKKETALTFGDEKEKTEATTSKDNTSSTLGNKVNVYLFYGSTCSHCENFLNWYDSLESSSKDKINLIKYEVWNNSDNNTLSEKVADVFDVSLSGVPFIVIGKKHWEGYSEEIGNEILTEVENEYKVSKSTRYDIKDNVDLTKGNADKGCIVDSPKKNTIVKIDIFANTIDEFYLNGKEIYFITDEEKLYYYNLDKKDYTLIESDVDEVDNYSYYNIGLGLVYYHSNKNGYDLLELKNGKSNTIAEGVSSLDIENSSKRKLYMYVDCSDYECDYSYYDGKKINKVFGSVFYVIKESKNNYILIKNYSYSNMTIDLYYSKNGKNQKITNDVEFRKTSLYSLY